MLYSQALCTHTARAGNGLTQRGLACQHAALRMLMCVCVFGVPCRLYVNKGRGYYDWRSDLYSLAVTVHVMLTQTSPLYYEGMNIMSLPVQEVRPRACNLRGMLTCKHMNPVAVCLTLCVCVCVCLLCVLAASVCRQ